MDLCGDVIYWWRQFTTLSAGLKTDRTDWWGCLMLIDEDASYGTGLLLALLISAYSHLKYQHFVMSLPIKKNGQIMPHPPNLYRFIANNKPITSVFSGQFVDSEQEPSSLWFITSSLSHMTITINNKTSKDSIRDSIRTHYATYITSTPNPDRCTGYQWTRSISNNKTDVWINIYWKNGFW